MSRYGSNAVKVEFDNSGGALTDMSAYVTEIDGFDIEAALEDTTAMGDANITQAATGFKVNNDINLGGFYDDTAATGPDAIFNAPGNTTTRTLKVTWGGTKSTAVETVIKKYQRIPSTGKLTRYKVVLAPSGSVTEA